MFRRAFPGRDSAWWRYTSVPMTTYKPELLWQRMATKRPDHGNYNWVEIVSKKPAATQAFFSKVFGWKFEKDRAMEGYTFYTTTAEPHGGLRTPMMKGEPAGTLPYIGVKSIDKTLAKIKAAHGKILFPKTEIPPGWFAVFQAPGGVVQAIIEGR